MSNNSEKKGATPKGEKGGKKMYWIEYWGYDENTHETYYPVPQEMIDKLQSEMQKCINEGGPFENEKEEASMRREIIDNEDFYVDKEGYGLTELPLYYIHLDDFYYE